VQVAGRSIPRSTPLNVTIEVTLPLDGANRGVLETLDALRETVRGIGAGTVRAIPTSEASLWDTHVDPGCLVIVPEERSVWRGSEEVRLSRLEFDLLLFLADHPRKVFSRRQLLESVWGYTHASPRTVDVHVRRLRAKLGERSPVTTVRGVGYRLDSEGTVAVERDALPG
jgi:DNA-binding response OmpR family regulator